MNERQFEQWLAYRRGGDRPFVYQFNADFPMFCHIPKIKVFVARTLANLTDGVTDWDLCIPSHPLERWNRRVRRGNPMDKVILSVHLQERVLEVLAGHLPCAILVNNLEKLALFTRVYDTYVGPTGFMVVKFDKHARNIRLSTILTPIQALSRPGTRRAVKYIESLESASGACGSGRQVR